MNSPTDANPPDPLALLNGEHGTELQVQALRYVIEHVMIGPTFGAFRVWAGQGARAQSLPGSSHFVFGRN